MMKFAPKFWIGTVGEAVRKGLVQVGDVCVTEPDGSWPSGPAVVVEVVTRGDVYGFLVHGRHTDPTVCHGAATGLYPGDTIALLLWRTAATAQPKTKRAVARRKQ